VKKKKNRIKVEYTKLGKEQADGQALSNLFAEHDVLIKLDERLSGRNLISANLHESLHWAMPTTHEEEILRIERLIVKVLWMEMKKHPEKYLKGLVKG